MKPKTKSELMAVWASQPDQLKREREVKAIRKAMDDARAVMQDGLTRYVKKKTKARSMAKAESGWMAISLASLHATASDALALNTVWSKKISNLRLLEAASVSSR